MYNKRILFSDNAGHKAGYLVVGGGGAGGVDMGGGGGAGGFLSSNSGSAFLNTYYTHGPTTGSFEFGVTYNIQVGAGAAGQGAGVTLPAGASGGDSFLSSSDATKPFSRHAFGGGGGASEYGQTTNNVTYNARSGGSGGGATGYPMNAPGVDGQGFEGGSYIASYYPGGGGGAGGPGKVNPGDAGIGRRFDIFQQEYWWAGGGGGGGYSARAGNGGKGGGGGGGPLVSGGGFGDTSGLAWNNGANAGAGSLNSQTNVRGGNAGANTGGGGGGGSHYNDGGAGNGGSGIVIIFMPLHCYSGQHTGSPLVQSGSFNTSGAIDHVALIYTQSGTYTSITGSGVL